MLEMTAAVNADRADQTQERYLPAREVWQRYSISDMTLHRWLRDQAMGFPKPTYLGRYRYWRLSQLLMWEASRETN